MALHGRLAERSIALASGCIEFQGATRYGYGQIRVDRRTRLTHRLAWEIAHGPIPDGLCVLHRCDNRRCINVDHLFLGTKADNTRDMLAKGRHHSQQKTHCANGHPLTEENLLIVHTGERQPSRACRTCRRASQRAWKERQR